MANVECGKQVIHPIYYKEDSLPNLKDMKITLPWYTVVAKDNFSTPQQSRSTLNKNGDVIYFDNAKKCLQKLEKITGTVTPYCVSSLENNTDQSIANGEIFSLAVDKEDTVYVLLYNDPHYILSVYNTNGRNTHHTLQFLNKHPTSDPRLTVTDDGAVVIAHEYREEKNIKVYLCNSEGEVMNSFYASLEDHSLSCMTASCNKIILMTIKCRGLHPLDLNTHYFLHIYTHDGELQKSVKYHDHEDIEKFFSHNHITNSVILVYYDANIHATLITHFSGETGERQRTYYLFDTNIPFPFFRSCSISNNNGALAFIHHNHVLYLKKTS